MEFKELQNKITEIFLSNLKRDNIEITDDYLMLKINEELGELVQSYTIHKKSVGLKNICLLNNLKREWLRNFLMLLH